MEREFENTIGRLQVRPGQNRYDEIMAAKQRYRELGQFQDFVDVPGHLPDTMCVGFSKPAAMIRISCVWNCEVVEHSMREQLSFAFARKVAKTVILFVDW